MDKSQFLESTLKDFTTAYFGKDRCCRCGCRGEYISTSYMVNPRSEVNDLKFSKRLQRAKKLVMNGAEFSFGGNHVNISYGNNLALTFYND